MAANQSNKPRRRRVLERNKRVEQRFKEIQIKHPRWRTDAVIDVLAEEFFLSPATITHILSGHYERYFFNPKPGKNQSDGQHNEHD